MSCQMNHLGKKTKKKTELGGFHHDSSNNRLQHDIEKKRIEDTKTQNQYTLFAYCLGYSKTAWRTDLFLEESKGDFEKAKSSFSELKPCFGGPLKKKNV